jgi:hypothetical protein
LSSEGDKVYQARPRAKRASLRIGVVSLWCLGLSSLPGFSTASASQATPKGREFYQEVVRTGSEDLVLEWRANTPKAGGRFRLYISVEPGSFFLIHEEPTRAGTLSYSHRDHQHFEEGTFYQLRYVAGNGSERVVGTIYVRTVELHPIPSAAQSLPGGERALAGALTTQPILASWALPAPVSRRHAFDQPEPEQRPPRV